MHRHLGLPYREVVQQDQLHVLSENVVELLERVDLHLARQIGRCGTHRT